MKPPRSTATSTLEEVVIGVNQSFDMEPPTATDMCDAKSKNVTTHSTKDPELVYSAEQRRVQELLVVVEEKCTVAQRDGYDAVW